MHRAGSCRCLAKLKLVYFTHLTLVCVRTASSTSPQTQRLCPVLLIWTAVPLSNTHCKRYMLLLFHIFCFKCF